MKKKLLLCLTACLLLGSLVWSMAAADEDDPLASLSYLTGTFTELSMEPMENIRHATTMNIPTSIWH